MPYSINNEDIEVQRMDHHGLVAAACHELNLAEKINNRIGSSAKDRIVQPGQSVVAMIINGLGFSNKRLYLTPKFFENKPVSLLLGEEIEARHLNDDTLGKALDEIATYGASQLVTEVAFEVASEHQLLSKRAHLDSTSFAVHGAYENPDKNADIEVTYGYSKDHRPDLKQVMMSMVVSGKSNIPIWMEPQSRNSSDQATFPTIITDIRNFKNELHKETDSWEWIADSALYTRTKLLSQNDYYWISRVPEKISEAKRLVETAENEFLWKKNDDNYKYSIQESEYGDIAQRWLLVYSEYAFRREKKTLVKKIKNQEQLLIKEIKKLSKMEFFLCKGCSSRNRYPC